MTETRVSFSAATAIKALSSHTYSGNFPQDWCIGSVPHGGLVTACFMRVASLHFSSTLSKQEQPHTITAHLEFLRRTEVGEVLFTVREVKLGRQTSTIHITLSQSIRGNRREEVVGYLINSNLQRESGPSFETEWRVTDPVPVPARPSRDFHADKDPGWAELKSLPFEKFRKSTTKLRWFLPRRGHPAPGCVDQWITFSPRASEEEGNGGKKEKFTNESIGFVVDSFPQVVEILAAPPGKDLYSLDLHPQARAEEEKDVGRLYWYPTVLLNLEVKKALPAEGVDWLFARVRAKQVKNGRYDLEVIILDEVGDLIALSHHVVLVVSAARNIAERSKM